MASPSAYGDNLARRILTGAGALTLVPYRVDPLLHVEVLAHGVDALGRLLVIVPASDAALMGASEVRVDGVKKALEFDADITVASLHALAQLTWLPVEEGSEVLGLTLGPHLALGHLETESVLVHGPNGVTRTSPQQLLAHDRPHELTSRELDARDEVTRLSDSQLSTLHSNALVGMGPGMLLSERDLAGCTPSGDRLWIVDVDHSGIVLLKLVDARLTTVLVSFPEQVDTITDLAGAVDALATYTSVRHASPRI
ncbi:MAG: hypothetical protein Q4G50_09560 [Corynebacterium sp.]|uniref:hypothetical protein n=1 Tax=Corynebacterium sp. TaxID=1720 RepID=UPI0026E0708C|nr:hypothetical protein [Corynebacterium sp.]MDO5670238.1 hypothetical protein [Corynebacterium sp.]